MIRDDLRLAFRSVVRAPSFTAFSLVCITVAVCASAVVGSLLRATAWKPIPFSDRERLVIVYATTDRRIADSFDAFAWSEYDNWVRNAPPSLNGLAAYALGSAQLEEGARQSSVAAATVTGNFFDVLGKSVVAGPGFSRNAGASAGEVVVSDRFVREHVARSPAVGSVIRLDGIPLRIVGVVSSSRTFPAGADVWAPVDSRRLPESERRVRSFLGVARLAPEATKEVAATQLAQLQARLTADRSDGEFRGAALRSLVDVFRPGSSSWAWMLAAIVFFILLIGCATIANLILVRVSSRNQEIAIRMALGASRRRIARQLMSEAAILGIVGGALGLGLTAVATPAVATLIASHDGRPVDLQFDAVTAVVGVVAAIATVSFFGLLSLAGVDDAVVGGVLRASGTASEGKARIRIRDVIVVSEIALAVLLGTAAITLGRSAAVLSGSESGLQTKNVSIARIDVPGKLAKDSVLAIRLATNLESQLRAMSASGRVVVWSARGPRMHRDATGAYMRIAGRDSVPLKAVPMMSYDVAGDLFGALGMKILRGRGLLSTDERGSQQVAVINEQLAKMIWPNDDPVGKTFTLGAYPTAGPISVVGVVSNSELIREGGSRFNFLIRDRFFPLIFRPLAQVERLGDPGTRDTRIFVGLSGLSRPAARRVAAAIHDVHPSLQLAQSSTYEEFRANRQLSVSMRVVASTGFVALGLALLGVLAVVQETTRRRTAELCLRLALGAQPRHILSDVLRRTLGVLAIGVAAGTYLPIVFSDSLQRILYGITDRNAQGILFGGVSAFDLTTMIGVALTVSVVVLIAAVGPVLRALRLNPALALREQ